MRSKTQEEHLLGKGYFEIWAATLGVKIYRYYSDNVIFAEQPFRSSIKESNQTIKYCGVGSYYQKSILETIGNKISTE